MNNYNTAAGILSENSISIFCTSFQQEANKKQVSDNQKTNVVKLTCLERRTKNTQQ